MTDTSTPRPPRLQPRRVLIIALFSAAIALAITLWVGNNPSQAAACPLHKTEAAAIDAVAVGELAALNGTGDGRSYADMALKDPAGADISVADFKGKKLLINFWASWCLPCREEMPALEALEQKKGSPEFEVVAVNIDTRDPNKPKAWLKEVGIQGLAYYADPEAKVFQDLKGVGRAFGMPTTMLIDRNGCEIGTLSGPAEWASEDAIKLIDAALAGAKRGG